MHVRRRNRLTVSNGLGRVDVSTASTTGIVGSINFDHGLLRGFVFDDPGLEKDMGVGVCEKNMSQVWDRIVEQIQSINKDILWPRLCTKILLGKCGIEL